MGIFEVVNATLRSSYGMGRGGRIEEIHGRWIGEPGGEA